ncbi:MAG: PD40 domain-containing protein [Bacteroidetes bacterium]|nr:PD40 domain-containing protein [Bacteroidota bacterium]
MTKKLTLLLLYILPALAFPQNKQTKHLVKEAQYYFDGDQYLSAWSTYKKIILIDSNNETAGINAAICAFKLFYPIDSVSFLTQNLTASKLPDAKFYLAKIKHQQQLFDEALILLKEYQAFPAKKKSVSNEDVVLLANYCQNGKQFIAKPHRSVIKNSGGAINTKYAEFSPVLNIDETIMYFTSRREGSSGNKKDANNNYLEDIYVSNKENDIWQEAKNIGPPLNTEVNDACVSLSTDAQHMILFRTSNDIINGDLMTSALDKNGKWLEPLKLGIEINSQYIETHACFSNDTSEIFFTSNRPGGYGGKDIYRVRKLPNGKWALPFNLGPNINTLYDEESPFLHPDGLTLFFSSRGHNSMGEYDVFKSTFDKENNNFSKAENLGYPINDVGNDLFFTLNINGLKGYYSSIKKDGYGNLDIYEIDTRFNDNDVIVKSGYAYKGTDPGKVKITLLDNEGNLFNGIYYSNTTTGKFILAINPLKSYKAIVESDGYNTIVVDIDPIVNEKKNNDIIFKLSKKE